MLILKISVSISTKHLPVTSKIPVRKYKTDIKSLLKTKANHLRKTVLRKPDLQMYSAVLKNPLKSRKSEEKTARNMTQVRKADGNVIHFYKD